MDIILSLLDTTVYYNPLKGSREIQPLFKLSEYNLCVDKVEDLPQLQKFFLSLDLVELEKERVKRRIEKLFYGCHNPQVEMSAFLQRYSSAPLSAPGVEEYLEEKIFPYVLSALNRESYYNLSTKFFNVPTNRNVEYSRCITYRREEHKSLYLLTKALIEKRKNLLDELEQKERDEILTKALQVGEGYYLYLRFPDTPSSIIEGKLVRQKDLNFFFFKEEVLPLTDKHNEDFKKYKICFDGFSASFISWFKEAWQEKTKRELDKYLVHIYRCFNREHCFNLSTRNFNLSSRKSIERSRFFSYCEHRDKPLYDSLFKLVEERGEELREHELQAREAILKKVKEVREGFYLEISLPGDPILLSFFGNEGVIKVQEKLVCSYRVLPLSKDHRNYEELKKYKLALSEFSDSFLSWFKDKIGEKEYKFTKEKEVEDYLCALLDITKEEKHPFKGRQISLETGRADILYFGTIIEIKRSSRWREAITQLHEYNLYFLGFRKVLIIFGEGGEKKVQKKVCADDNISLYYFSDIYQEVESAQDKKAKLISLLQLSL